MLAIQHFQVAGIAGESSSTEIEGDDVLAAIDKYVAERAHGGDARRGAARVGKEAELEIVPAAGDAEPSFVGEAVRDWLWSVSGCSLAATGPERHEDQE